MHLQFDSEAELNTNRFRRLGTWFALALATIAVAVIAGQLMIQSQLAKQTERLRVADLIAEQRVLAQQIASAILQFSTGNQKKASDLPVLLSGWQHNHQRLQSAFDAIGAVPDEPARLFAALHPHYEAIAESALRIVTALQEGRSPELPTAATNILLRHEQRFLSGMKKTADAYALQSHESIVVARRQAWLLMAVLLTVITLEAVFFFRPAARKINESVHQLIAAEKNARKLSKEIGALYASLERSYEKVAMVNQPVDNPRLFAKADRGGNVLYVSDTFRSLSLGQPTGRDIRICDLFNGMENADDWMDEIIETVSDGHYWNGELRFMAADGSTRWAAIMITAVYHDGDEVSELVVMGADITARKIAELTMKEKNRAEIERKINQQKFRSVLILEGQEEERHRIARDIHDGIGQMLTSLKYQIESIDVNNREKAGRKLAEVDGLIKDVIREVRRVTFNLKPTVLGDYGLQAALNVFVRETAKLVDVPLVFEASGDIDRLPQKIENNIFRIVQEAINNAIKYSQADLIEVHLSRIEDNIVVTVRDEGKGFDTRLVEARSLNIDSGRGFFNMYERTEYVNGQLTIASAPGKGTTVTLTVPVNNAVSLEV